jgi:protein TonB
MKTAAYFALLSAILSPGLLVQPQAPPTAIAPPHHIRISAKAAEKLLLQKVEICYDPSHAWASRVSGTVILTIEIDKNGYVLHPAVISGPFMLQKPVLDAVQKYYKYKPYLLNGKAVDVETTVSVFVGLQCNSPTPYLIH